MAAADGDANDEVGRNRRLAGGGRLEERAPRPPGEVEPSLLAEVLCEEDEPIFPGQSLRISMSPIRSQPAYRSIFTPSTSRELQENFAAYWSFSRVHSGELFEEEKDLSK